MVQCSLFGASYLSASLLSSYPGADEYCTNKRNVRAGEMAQRLRATAALVVDLGWGWVPSSQLCRTTVRELRGFFLLDAGQACSFWYCGLSYSFSKTPSWP